MKKYTEEDLRKAFNAGRESVKQNNDLDRLLDEGTKHAPERMTFDTWFFSMECQEKSSSANNNLLDYINSMSKNDEKAI